MSLSKELLVELATQFDTPLYVYHQQQLQDNLRRFRTEITYRPLTLHAALMANDTPQLLALCRDNQVGAFVNSPRHLSVALHQVGWNPSEIIYASSNNSEATIQRLAELGVTFHANSLRELNLYGRYAHHQQLGLRLAWPMPGQTQSGRLGLTLNELETAQQIAQRHQLKINGLHVYLGTNITQADYYLQQLEKVLPINPPIIYAITHPGAANFLQKVGYCPLNLSPNLAQIYLPRIRSLVQNDVPHQSKINQIALLYTQPNSITLEQIKQRIITYIERIDSPIAQPKPQQVKKEPRRSEAMIAWQKSSAD